MAKNVAAAIQGRRALFSRRSGGYVRFRTAWTGDYFAVTVVDLHGNLSCWLIHARVLVSCFRHLRLYGFHRGVLRHTLRRHSGKCLYCTTRYAVTRHGFCPLGCPAPPLEGNAPYRYARITPSAEPENRGIRILNRSAVVPMCSVRVHFRTDVHCNSAALLCRRHSVSDRSARRPRALKLLSAGFLRSRPARKAFSLFPGCRSDS